MQMLQKLLCLPPFTKKKKEKRLSATKNADEEKGNEPEAKPRSE
jgi:hypothetical protein